jgi:tetraacyldisaccharide 4'-kinase
MLDFAAMGVTSRGFYMSVISGERAGVLATTLRCILWAASILYGRVIAARNASYDMFRWRTRRVGVPVISIGNITTGGTGKTPTAAHIAHLLAARGRRVAILLRGYKGSEIQFDDDQRDEAAAQWRVHSDEAMVLRRRCPRAEVILNPDRLAGAKEAIAKRCDAIVLDDGFQHRRMARDLNVVLVDATSPFGFGYLLPRGMLREPLTSLLRADLIVLTRSDEVDEPARSDLVKRISGFSGDKPVIASCHRAAGFCDLKGGGVSVPDVSGMQAVIFAGIGNFAGFRRLVERLGVHILAAYEFPDHHAYTPEEISGVADAAASVEANVILTTEKDAVKLVGRWSSEACRLLVVSLEVEFVGEGGRILNDAVEAALSRPHEESGSK